MGFQSMQELLESYEKSLQLVQKRINELRLQKEQPGITPKERDNLASRITILYEERAELKCDITDIRSYLRAQEGAAAS